MEAPRRTAEPGFTSAISDEQYRLLVHSVKDYAIFLLDPAGRVVTWNEGALRLKGYREEEILGRHFSIFYPQATAATGWPEHELEVAAREGRFEDEGWRVRKDGSQFWADVVITAVRDQTGALVGFAKVTRDLTEHKFAGETLRQSEERYRLLVEAVRDYAIFMLDPQGNVVTWNQGAERLKGYLAPEIIGRHFSAFYPPEAIASRWPERELEIARDEGRFEDEGWRVRKDGSRFWANVVITAVHDRQGRLQGFTKVTRDITGRKRLEEQAQRLNEELTLRVRELDGANRALAEKSEQNEAFVYSVSHDVRGPLVSLQGFSEEVQRSAADLMALLVSEPNVPADVREAARRIIDDDITESVRFIQTAEKRLSDMFDSLLRLSRTGRVVYASERVDVAATVRRILDSLRGTVEQQHAEIVIDDLPPAWGDPAAIEQVFANLIGNALRYRDPARPCRVEIGGAEKCGSTVYYVKDNGLGIPGAAIDKLFTAFRRFHPEVGPGEGMGLATARRIVERHNGAIRVESQPGAGATFYVELPNRAPQAST